MAGPHPTSLTAGRLFYLCFHQPLTWLRDRRDTAEGRRGTAAMRAAAAALSPVALPEWGLRGPPCRFLTGARFFHQTIFCARSFEWACGTHVPLEIFTDGTLGPAEAAALRRALPRASIADEAATLARLDRVLPAAHFPVLRAMRAGQPLMRKLLDAHAGLAGPALYLDSDMLFFGTPNVLRDWLRNPDGEFFMQQQGDALVSPRDELEPVLGQALLPGVNSGIVAVQNDGFDWPALEVAAARLTGSQRNHLWAEQTLFAWHLSRRHATPLSTSDYCLCFDRHDVARDRPVLRHYVHKAKALYAAREWRLWLELSRQPPAGRA